jgi:hypothetical protein
MPATTEGVEDAGPPLLRPRHTEAAGGRSSGWGSRSGLAHDGSGHEWVAPTCDQGRHSHGYNKRRARGWWERRGTGGWSPAAAFIAAVRASSTHFGGGEVEGRCGRIWFPPVPLWGGATRGTWEKRAEQAEVRVTVDILINKKITS